VGQGKSITLDATDSGEALAGVRARCQRPLSSADFYQQLWDAGYQLGPTFRWLDEIWRGEGEVVCRMRRPHPSDHADRYMVPPGLIDSCFQLVAASFDDAEISRLVNDQIIAVPVGVVSIQTLGCPDTELWCHVVSERSPSTDEVFADIRLFDDTGQLHMLVEGFRAKRVSREALVGRRPERAAEWLYELQWRRAELPADSTPAPATWIVLMDRGVVGKELVAALESAGHTCLCIDYVENTSPDFFRTLLRPCRAVVNLWALESPEEPCGDDPALIGTLHLVQALAQAGWRDAPRLFLITRDAQSVADGDGGDEVSPVQASLWGLGRTVALEHPELACTRIDIGAGTTSDALMRELAPASREDQIALRGDGRYVARLVRPAINLQAPSAPIFVDATYLITGGLGGVGLTVARWLIERGARYLALLGRSARNGAALAELRAQGAEVEVFQADVANERRMAEVFEHIDRTMPPLRGVIHAAAVLDDGILLQLTRERFRTVIDPKVLGAWRLHKLTENRRLDFFVLFSSLASLLGSPGQGSYAAANAFIDALSHYRRVRGLPGLSINWGPWAEVGQAAAVTRRGERLELRGVASLRPSLGLDVLNLLMANDRAQVGVMRFNLRQWREFYPAAPNAPFMAELRDEQALSDAHPTGHMRPALAAAAPEGRRALLLSHLKEQFGQVLRIDPAQIDANVALGSLGLDSLMGLEIRNRLEASLGLTLSATMAWTYPTLAALTTHLADKMELTLEQSVPASSTEDTRLAEVADSIAGLSDTEMEALIMKKLGL
jgi:nucleoside-diphosphate-sugar epimerase/acyl carrier protein